jgi:tetratricopeptide (TPR) repeat protein
MRSRKKRKFVPCVIFSKRMTEEDIILTRELGFEDILGMPFDRDRARTVIGAKIEHEKNLDPREHLLRKVETLMLDGSYREAYRLIDPPLLKASSFQTRAQLNYAEIHIELGDEDKAEKLLEEVLQREPAQNRALQIKAKILSRRGKHDQAIEVLRRLTITSPKNLSHKVDLGKAYIHADRHEEAKAVLQEVQSIDSSHQDCLDQLGTIAFKEGNFGLAQQLISQTENGNELARTFNNLGISHVSHQEFDEAIHTYQHAMALLGDKAKLYLLHYNLGLALRKKGELLASFEALATAYLSEPNFEKAYVALAKTYQDMKKSGVKPSEELVQKIKKVRTLHHHGRHRHRAAAS